MFIIISALLLVMSKALSTARSPSIRVAMSTSASKGLVWFRETDLRVHDNAALKSAHSQCTEVAHVFCFNPKEFMLTENGIEKTGFRRFLFLLECVNDLSERVKVMGGHLSLFLGKPTSVIPKIFESNSELNHIYFQKSITDYEVKQELSIKSSLTRIRPTIAGHSFFGDSFLINPADLPFPVNNLEYFTSFRKNVEKNCVISDPSSSLTSLKEVGKILQKAEESLNEFVITEEQRTNPILLYQTLLQAAGRSDLSEKSLEVLKSQLVKDPRAVLPFCGGETAALARVQHYITNGVNRLSVYKETRNGLTGADYSSKLSPWLATGCISVKTIHKAVKQFEATSGIANENTYWLIFELLWRDYMQYYAMKFRNTIFHLGGPQGADGDRRHPWKRDPVLFAAWVEGRTGYPFIDANMRELRRTGFMSNRGRQVVASFLVRDMGLDWRLGAQHFESTLLDFDVCSNYGNWQYVAGVGSDPREDRYFNIIKQARDYDPKADYIRLWCPEISHLPTAVLIDPRQLTDETRRRCGVALDVLPEPVVPLMFGGPTVQSSGDGQPGGGGKQNYRKKPAHGGVPGRKQAW